MLSAGGLLHDWAAQGVRIEIWTLMAGFPSQQELSDFGRRMHAEWGTTTPEATVRLRRAEDREAAGTIAASCRYFDFIDCLYRRDENGKPLYTEAIHMPIHTADTSLPGQICAAIQPALCADDRIICQLGIGEHVDHLLVRSAAEMLERPLLYTADVPYVLDHPDELGPRTVGFEGLVEPVSDAGFAAWEQAIMAYRSQLSTLFPSLEGMHERLYGYWASSRGLRLWRRTAS